MAINSKDLCTLLEKLDRLPPERVAEVEDFVDFLNSQEQSVTRAATKMSAHSFQKIWDNVDDAAYDVL